MAIINEYQGTPISAATLDAIESDGFAAYREGGSNPHNDRACADAWAKGWHKAQGAHEAREALKLITRQLATIAASLDTVNHGAARAIHRGRDALHDAAALLKLEA